MSNNTGFPEKDETKTTEEQGIFRKYEVSRVDGRDGPGYRHHDCELFVLDLSHDPFAQAAVLAYAEACKNQLPQLAADIRKKYGY